MPVVAKFSGIVIRQLIDRTFGTHVHAFYGDAELVLALQPPRVIQGEAPSWVEEWVLHWVGQHEKELLSTGSVDLSLPVPISRQVAEHRAFAD